MALDREQVGLLFKLQADTGAATLSLNDFKEFFAGVVQGMRVEAGQQFDRISSNIKSSLKSTETAFVKFGENATSSLKGALSQYGILGDTLADMLPAASSGMLAVGASAAVAAAGMVSLSLKTAEYAGQIKDLSDKTNLTTDTLQSLRLAATLSGQSFESISQTAVIFQRRMEEARTKGGELAATFKALGVNLSGPVDEAFRNTLEKLSGFKDSAEKTALTVDLFGRSGADLLPVIKQLDGQFSNLENRARELGIVLSKDAIEKADAFGDQLDILKLQVGGVANQIGSVLIPALSNMVTGLGNAITYTDRAADSTRTYEQRLKDAAKAALLFLSYLNPLSGAETRMMLQPGGAGTPQNEFESFFEHESGLTRIKKPKDTKPKKEQMVKLPVLDFDKMTAQYFDRLNKLTEDSLKKLDQARERSAATQEAILKEIEQREIDSIKAQVDQRVISEEEGAARVAAVRVAAFARTEDALKAQLDKQTTELAAAQAEAAANQYNLTLGPVLAAKAAQLDAERTLTVQKITQLQEDRTSIELEGNRQIAEAREQDTQNYIQHLENLERLEVEAQERRKQRLLADPSSALSIFGEAGQAAADKGVGLFGQLASSANEALGSVSNSMGNMQSMFADAFGTIGAGLGSMIEAFILTGELGPQAFRKLAAGVLASLAAQSAVKAIFELAEGWAASAAGLYVQAGQHFAAAKLFGLVAVAAGIAGKAIAPGGSGAASGAGAGGRSQFGSTDKRIIEQGGPLRGSQQPQIIIIRAETEPGVVVRKIVDDYRSNGASRQVLRRDMLGEG